VTTPKLAVRPIADGEQAVVNALWHTCGLTRPWNDPEQDLAFARGKANSDVLVGLCSHRIVASAMVGHDGHRGTMYYVCVDPALQRRGFGRQIVAAAETWLTNRGVWKINLLVRAAATKRGSVSTAGSAIKPEASKKSRSGSIRTSAPLDRLAGASLTTGAVDRCKRTIASRQQALALPPHLS